MSSLLIIPDKDFNFKRIKKLIKLIRNRWKDDLILCIKENFKNRFNQLKVKKFFVKEYPIILDEKFIRKVDKSINKIILAAKENYRVNFVKFSSDFTLKIYKELPYNGDGGIALLHGITDEDDYPYLNSHIFNYITKDLDYVTYQFHVVFFPYFGLVRFNNFGDINELGFRDELTHDLIKRDKDHILIVFTGGSGCMDIFSPRGKRCSDILEKILNKRIKNFKFTVLNFGMGASTLLDEIMVYTLLLYKFKPNIVISWDGYNEMRNGYINDSFLLKNFNILYMNQVEEIVGKLYGKSVKVDLTNKKNNLNKVVQVYFFRKKQFKNLVEENKGKFISVLQPMLPARKFPHKFEILRLDDKLKEEIIEFLDKVNSYKNLLKDSFWIDLNEYIKDISSSKLLFYDPIHQTPEANKIFAEYLYKKIIRLL